MHGTQEMIGKVAMLDKVKALNGYKLRGRDGEMGTAEDFYFDDHHWTIRYLIANTGTWLAERQVLISPHALTLVNKKNRFLAVDLTKKQIEGSPSLNSDKPVSRQYEEDYYGYYGWPTYWNGPFTWGPYEYIPRDPDKKKGTNQGGKPWDHHLRSISNVTGYDIHASDGEIGHVDDFIIDDESWTIRYLIIDTRNWLPGKKVLISPKWIDNVSWDDSKVFIKLSRDAVKQSPEYTEESLLSRDYEIALHKHYELPGYW
jgi:hypothetical protein